MVCVSIDDFYQKADACFLISRQEEIECAKAMNAGDATAREYLIQSYIPIRINVNRH